MLSRAFLLACAVLASLPSGLATETILGVYIFSRHGDRTAKITPPTSLTDLGYKEIYDSGTRFRNRYVAGNATSKIAGISSDLVKLSQLAASAPVDNVLMSSAQAFLQGLYPAVGATLGSDKLRNGSTVEAPLDGYQLIPIETVASGIDSEDSAWLQGSTNCANALTSSNEYFYTADYLNLLNSTRGFYAGLTPMLNGTFATSQISYKNAYTIFDYLNVASIHDNSSLPLLTPSTQQTLLSLASAHEYALAYNSSSPIRAVEGSTLAAQILQALTSSLLSPTTAPRLNVQLGAYASFLSFFGLASLPAANPDFYGIPDYTASMTFELFTPGPTLPAPNASDVRVRFLYHNGTSATSDQPTAYPLFGTNATDLAWADFAAGMSKFAIGNQGAWCTACGNTTGVCAAASGSGSGNGTVAGSEGGQGQGSGRMSNAVAGVIGAMVTLTVVLGLEALAMVLGGLRIIRKRREVPVVGADGAANGAKA